MADVFIECLVEQRKTVSKRVQAALYIALYISIAVLLFTIDNVVVRALLPIVLVGGGWGVWWLLRNQNIEYEYVLTNGELDIDRILGRSRRKRVMTVDARAFECCAPYTEANMAAHKSAVFVKTLDASSGSGDRMFAIAPSKENKGRVLLIFQPDERMLTAIKNCNRRLGL